MIAINKELLKNTFFVCGAESLREGGFITSEQLRTVRQKYPTLKAQNNPLVRIGFFILGVLLYSSIVGAVSLFAMPVLESNYEIMIFIYAMIGLVGSEFFAKKDYYGYGFDDAFIIGFQFMLALAVGVNSESILAGFITLALTGIICCIRYVNTISALLALIGIAGVFATLILDLGIIQKFYLSFVMFFLALGTYIGYAKMSENPQAYYFKYALRMMQVFSLILGYLSVNYLVVRELSSELIGVVVQGNNDIPLAILFYILTFLIPLAFLVNSLKQKSREMLIIGILAFAFSVFSIKYYYSLMPIENALILAGILLFAVVSYCIRKLRHKESGITFMRDRNTDANSLLYAQAIIVNSQINVSVDAPESDMPFGGGGFSGGGAGGTY